MTSEAPGEIVRRMQGASSPDVAERSRWKLEASIVPNGALRSGAEEVAWLVKRGLERASAPGKSESWELLSQLAAGTVAPTSADDRVRQSVRVALREVVAAAVERASATAPEPFDFLAVDVLDSMLSGQDESTQVRIVVALRRFAARGPTERRRVTVVLGSEEI